MSLKNTKDTQLGAQNNKTQNTNGFSQKIFLEESHGNGKSKMPTANYIRQLASNIKNSNNNNNNIAINNNNNTKAYTNGSLEINCVPKNGHTYKTMSHVSLSNSNSKAINAANCNRKSACTNSWPSYLSSSLVSSPLVNTTDTAIATLKTSSLSPSYLPKYIGKSFR